MKKRFLSIFLLLTVLFIDYFAARVFLRMRQPDTIVPGAGVTRTFRLSRYAPSLSGSRLDTEVYVLEGEVPGGTLLITGGHHPNEPAGFITAVLLIEHVRMHRGTMIVIPQANRSGFSCTDPGEGMPDRFFIDTPAGKRSFRLGSRFTSWVDQWPDPLVYLHHPSLQKLSGMETRNLNRAYPGRPDGSPTERVAHAITTLIRTENVDLAIDLHESAPEYHVNNAIIAHERASEIAAYALFSIQEDGIEYSLEGSPYNLRGLSHREWGDHTNAYALLLETGNPVQGRLRGKGISSLVNTGADPYYLRASRITDRDILHVPYDEEGISLDFRVGRHLNAIGGLVFSYSEIFQDRPISFIQLPQLDAVVQRGVGAYLLGNGIDLRPHQ